MSIANINGKLSRAEMKQIMAGSGDGVCWCITNDDCANTTCNMKGAWCFNYNSKNTCVFI